MDLKAIIDIVERKAVEIAEQEIKNYNKDFPELTLTEEAKESVRIRSTSQLTLQLSKFKFHTDGELDEQFNKWFKANEESDLRRACRHCLEEEAKKIREANGKNLSSLDAYLKKHLGDVHQID